MELGNHEAAIATLTGRELTLASELDQREARILELEALLQALEIAGDSRERSLTRSQVSLDILRADLTKTRDDYHTTCDEVVLLLQSVCTMMFALLDKRNAAEITKSCCVISWTIRALQS